MNKHVSWSRNRNMPKPKRKISPPSGGKTSYKPAPRPHETEEEATIRRFHDAQRMARFRAKRKKAQEKAQALETAKLAEMAVFSEMRNMMLQISEAMLTASQPRTVQTNHPAIQNDVERNMNMNVPAVPGKSKYSQLLEVIEELGKNIRLSYAGSRTSAERLRMGIVHARLLVRDCILETEMNSRQ